MMHPKKEQNINLPWTNLPWNLLWLVNDTVFAGVPTLNHQLICDDIRASILPCQSDRFTSLKASSNTRLAAVRGQNMVRQFWGAFPIPQSEFHKDLGQTKISRRHSYSSGTYTPSLKEKNFKQTPPPPFFQKKNLPSINWEFVCVRFTGKKKHDKKYHQSDRSFTTHCAASGPLATKPWAAARETASLSSKADVKALTVNGARDGAK